METNKGSEPTIEIPVKVIEKYHDKVNSFYHQNMPDLLKDSAIAWCQVGAQLTAEHYAPLLLKNKELLKEQFL